MKTKLIALTPLPKMSKGPRAKTNACECGCGDLTGARFVPGHDSRLRGWALRIERGLVGATPATFPGSRGELDAALAELARTNRKPHAATATKAPKARKPKAAKATPAVETPATPTE